MMMIKILDTYTGSRQEQEVREWQKVLRDAESLKEWQIVKHAYKRIADILNSVETKTIITDTETVEHILKKSNYVGMKLMDLIKELEEQENSLYKPK